MSKRNERPSAARPPRAGSQAQRGLPLRSGPAGWLAAGLLAFLVLCGCNAHHVLKETWHEAGPGLEARGYYEQLAASIEFPLEPAGDGAGPYTLARPLSLRDHDLSDDAFCDLTLEEALQIALSHSTVMRDLGLTILQAPGITPSIHQPAIQETDPRFGVEAALAAFDAEFATNAFFEKNDRVINNRFLGGGTQLFQQDLHVYQSQLSKRTAVGTELFMRNITRYDSNNAPGNLFPSHWETFMEMEFRQPLLQGAGATFNRIAGPGQVPGVLNGVLIARINTSIQLSEFEIALRNFISNVENAYWDLYFAYRDLDAKIAARDATLETWRLIRAQFEAGRRGFEEDKEARAREQYFRLEEEVQSALTGRLIEGTRTFAGSTGGTFRGTPGVQVAERRLRLILGLPINDGRLLRPVTEPVLAEVIFDWDAITAEALMRRTELQRQRWEVRRRELELTANRNFLAPRLDAVGRYRWRGFGNDLIHPHRTGRERFDNAFMDLTTGDFQEWQLGVELTVPIGYRRAHAAVQNSEWQLARERAVLREQERQVVHDLSNALAELDRAWTTARTNYNRLEAARTEVEAVEVAFEQGFRALPEQVLDAQRRLADADSRYYLSLVEYMIALRNVHLEKGSLLDYNDIHLVEGMGDGSAPLRSAPLQPEPVDPIPDGVPLPPAPAPISIDEPALVPLSPWTEGPVAAPPADSPDAAPPPPPDDDLLGAPRSTP